MNAACMVDYDQAIAVFEYSITMRELVHRYKYGREYRSQSYIRILYGSVAEKLFMASGYDYSSAFTQKQAKERGFNQAALLGEYISSETRFPVNREYYSKRGYKNTNQLEPI